MTAHVLHRPTHDHMVASELWVLALATILLACSAVLLVMKEPMALGIALAIGLLAIGARYVFTSVREREHARAEASSTVASTGLMIAAVAVAPLIAFALLWAGLLLLLGAMWLLNALGLI